MFIRIYNSLTRKKEALPEPQKGKPLRFFVCGPTVYDYPHIGHARTYIFFDFFAKYLRSRGYKLEYLQNITDIDDKIIRRAGEENKTPAEIAGFFTKIYLEDMKSLGISAVDKYAPATKFIPEIVGQVERLVEKGYAYKIENDGWYFDIKKFPDYGKLSGRTALGAEDAVSRIDEAVGKRNKGDFCLWKFSLPAQAGKAGEPVWKSKLGDGRPGWHIEDTAITGKYFGPQYDIHGGGIDLKFPHHEAEIAQQESVSGKKPFVKLWMHTGALLAHGKKMSKSLGNFLTIRDFLKKYSPEILRWLVLGHHYRSPINYSDDAAEQARSSLGKIMEFLGKLEMAAGSRKKPADPLKMKNVVEKAAAESSRALAEDLNTPFVVAHLFGLGLEYQEKIWGLGRAEAKILKNYIIGVLNMLGIKAEHPAIPSKIKKMAAEREKFRVSKQFIKSDSLRKETDGLGYIIEDTPQGPFIWPKNPS